MSANGLHARDFLHCPECGKKGVTRRIATSDDFWACRYCNFECYVYGMDKFDKQARAALRRRNPGAVI